MRGVRGAERGEARLKKCDFGSIIILGERSGLWKGGGRRLSVRPRAVGGARRSAVRQEGHAGARQDGPALPHTRHELVVTADTHHTTSWAPQADFSSQHLLSKYLRQDWVLPCLLLACQHTTPRASTPRASMLQRANYKAHFCIHTISLSSPSLPPSLPPPFFYSLSPNQEGWILSPSLSLSLSLSLFSKQDS